MLPITIIIPAYCTSKEAVGWLHEAVQSAVSQDCQVIVWDDGSTVDIEYKDIPNVRWYFKHQNHGPSYARNRCAEHVTTELLFPLDCDDVLVPGAMQELYAMWMEKPGVPVYPDLYKFGTVADPHYVLMNWSCELQMRVLGIASVNVLHAKSQWEEIGGWDESFTAKQLFEDSEYNARLFLSFCARNLHKPLIGYRQHTTQRTQNDRRKAVSQAAAVLKKIGGYEIMACCGKGRKTQSNAPSSATFMASNVFATAADAARSTELPGTQGERVLALYTGGKGKGTHYIRGIHTQFPYKVMYGQLYYVDPLDAKDEGDTSRSLFVRVNKDEVVVDDGQPQLQRGARVHPLRVPLIEALAVDINRMNVRDIEQSTWTPDEAKRLLEAEKNGRNRARAILHLERQANAG